MAQVATHNSRSSCWTVISGNVYDLTSWIPMHPGGEQNILQLCGIDGTTKFNGQHGNDSRAKSVLVGFKIGALVQ
jgi:cytochrome b involved in lipid metabolism